MSTKFSQLVGNLEAIVIFQDKTYSLEYCDKINEYCLVSMRTGLCNWIIRYDSGKIAYDKQVTNTIHNKVLKAITKHFKTLSNENTI